MLPYAFRKRVEMHGDFTRGVGSMVWLGSAWLPRGGGLRRTDTRMHLDGI